MKLDLKEWIAKITGQTLHATLFTETRSVGTGPSGYYVNKSDLGLPSGASIQGLIVENTPSNGFVVGNALDIDATRIYVGLYNHYSSSLSGTVGIRVLYKVGGGST